MSEKKDCSCGKHKKSQHEDMSQADQIKHLNECLGDVIERLECIKELAAKL